MGSRSVQTEQQSKAMRDRERSKAERHKADIQWLLGSERGRRLYWNWMAQSGLFQSSFTGNSETFFREGARNQGLKMLADMNAICPEQYPVMQREAQLDAKIDAEVGKAILENDDDRTQGEVTDNDR